MPAIRSVPAAKPVKTERSHEENQESYVDLNSNRYMHGTNKSSRAYIAASRRSDRSLEARIESARRASEIHKRRTGHSLRVTEQDVINEEMYEEEDDDLPMQYRRLTEHLQTQNADFDRRLAAYLTNHVAMRSALGQAVSDAWQSNQFNNIRQFMNPGAMRQQQEQQQQQQHQPNMQNSMLLPQMPNASPTSCRQSPYPVANAQGMHPAHGRSASIATSQDYSFQQQNTGSAHNSPIKGMKTEDRRMSMPVNALPQTPFSGNAALIGNHSSPTRAISRNASSSNLVKQQQHSQFQIQQQCSPSSQQPKPFQLTLLNNKKMSNPRTTALPMESEQLLAANPFNFSFNDTVPNMPQGAVPQKQTYSYNPNGRPASKPSSPTDDTTTISLTNMSNMGGMYGMGGMNATLAPSAFDPQTNFQSPAASAFSPVGYTFGGTGYNDMFSNDLLKEPLGGDSLSGAVTPGEGD